MSASYRFNKSSVRRTPSACRGILHLAKNRSDIKHKLMHEASEVLPTGVTDGE